MVLGSDRARSTAAAGAGPPCTDVSQRLTRPALSGRDYWHYYDRIRVPVMKTTIEISDPVLSEARRLAAREGVPLRALVELGLRRVIAEKTRRRLPPAQGEQGRWSQGGPPRRLLGAPARDGLRRARWLTAMDTLCRQHGVRELWSADRDFGRFPGLHVGNPLVSASVR